MQGMQMNPGVPTIELSLRDALVKAGGISKDNENKLNALRWTRSARTDKGVSALGQVVALRLMHPERLVERLEEYLPDKIKIFGIRHVRVHSMDIVNSLNVS
jgi:tRNA pseudouridine38-40 synthase